MQPILEQFRKILITAAFFTYAVTAFSQPKQKTVAVKAHVPVKGAPVTPVISKQLKNFIDLTNKADITVSFPAGFRETKIKSEDFLFDYAIETPDRECELWFQVKSLKKDWENYELVKNDPRKQTANPDSTYTTMGSAQAFTLAGDKNFTPRNISPEVLTRFNANSGRSYLLNLPDLPETRHYKYALVLAIQKDHTGTIVIACFTNEKDPEFYKNVNRISRYLKFKVG